LLLVLSVLWTIVADKRGGIVVDPVTMPKNMEEKGYTGLMAANVVAIVISHIQQATTTTARKERVELEETTPDIALPESNVSLKSAVRFLEGSLGWAPRHIQTELIMASGTNWDDKAPNDIVIFVQLTGAQSEWSSTKLKANTPEDALRFTGLEVLQIVEPY